MASTRLKIFESADAKDNNDEMLRDFMKFTSSSQEPEEKKENSSNRLQDRRATMAVLKDAHNKTRTNGEFINLEKQFKVKFAGRIQFIYDSFACHNLIFALPLPVCSSLGLIEMKSLKACCLLILS